MSYVFSCSYNNDGLDDALYVQHALFSDMIPLGAIRHSVSFVLFVPERLVQKGLSLMPKTLPS